VRVRDHDATVEAALEAAHAAGLWLILRIQDAVERRLVVEDGRVGRHRVTRTAGLGLHVFTDDGSVGFASVDEVSPFAARDAVARAGRLAEAARTQSSARTDAHRQLSRTEYPLTGVTASLTDDDPLSGIPIVRLLADAQAALSDVAVGLDRTSRTAYHAVDESWRIARSDGTDITFATGRAQTRHDLAGRIDGRAVRGAATVAADDPRAVLSKAALERLAGRTRLSALHARSAATAPAPTAGSYRLVLNHALAKGLAHEAIGHLCETDVDGSVLMDAGRLRLGQSLARPNVTVVDGPLPGDYAQQPVSANGIPRRTVRLIERGVLIDGLGDLFSAVQAGIAVNGACRAASYGDRPAPRMTNIRLELSDPLALPLDADPELLHPDAVLAALDQQGLLERGIPMLYLAGYRGGQAHPRRGDFVFGADAAYDLSAGGAPLGPASFSGLAERALNAIMAGIGALVTDAIGTCNKDGSAVSSSGGSHALLILDPDPDLVVSAAS
jgi:TldD protein